eukprot:CAMPEP_0202428314 /NCGR_PEP_ID=MMETSP1345-20130828/2352_1 /ASSEMBLY_ACC=CAM_ASM_000843 /TAXON_ID=342563 /ORGANISM="Fabrea Fabrea salina" /LENGTH=386 /DNA_ID=CAMNT_0049039269 /DNA_START=826 /DNA_END=1982 /DNA_ORIENTATION=-
MAIETGSYSWAFLVVSTLISALNISQWNSIPYIASASSFRKDLNISPQLYGVMTGPLFLSLVAICSFIHGSYLDKISQIKWTFLTYCGVASLALIGFSSCTENWQVLILAAVVACSSSGIPPAFFRQVGMYFPGHQRGIATGIYQMRIYLGGAFASVSILVAHYSGWQLGFFFVGSSALAATVLGGIFLRNDVIKKESLLEENQVGTWGKIKVLSKNPTMVLMVVAMFFRYAAGFSRGFYESLYFAEKFPDRIAEFSLFNAIAILLTPVSLFIAGKLADSKERQNKFKWPPLICGLTNLVSIPFVFVMYSTDSFAVAIACLLIVFPVSETYISLNLSILLNVTPKSMHALQTGILLCIGIFGASLSCLSLGVLSVSLDSLRNWLLV